MRPAALLSEQALACALLVTLSTAPGCADRADEDDVTEPGLVLIYDGDLGPDPCDFTTLSMLHEYHDREMIELIGVIGSTPDPFLASTFSIYNEIYGHDVPIGAYREGGHDVTYSQEVLDRYTAAVLLSTASNQNEIIFEKYGRDGAAASAEVYGSVELYRRLLAAADDQSVTIYFAGQLFNLPGLLSSPPDPISPSSGEALLARKVKEVVFMGGRFPVSSEHAPYGLTAGAEWNWWALGAQDVSRVAIKALAALGLPLTYVGAEIGAEVLVGQEIVDRLGRDHPTSEAYYQYNLTYSGDGEGLRAENPAYDDAALYHLVEGGVDRFFGQVSGHVEIDANGANTWTPSGAQERYLTLLPGVATELSALLTDRITGAF
jgi:hypothetical protein